MIVIDNTVRLTTSKYAKLRTNIMSQICCKRIFFFCAQYPIKLSRNSQVLLRQRLDIGSRTNFLDATTRWSSGNEEMVVIERLSSTVAGFYSSLIDVRQAVAFGQAMSRHTTYPVIVNKRGRDDKHVKDLMTLEPNIALSRKESFWNS